MYNLFNKVIREDTSTVITSIFILILPLVINIYISDMVLSIRYLSLSILIFILYLLTFKNGINTEIFKNPIVISLVIVFFVNLLSSVYHDLTPDAVFTLYRLFVFLSLTVIFANLFIKSDYLLIAKSILFFCLVLLLIYFWQVFIAITNEKEIVNSFEKISSTMGNKNLLASILFLSLPFLFYVYQLANKNWKTLVIITLILILCSLFLIQSRTVLLGLFFMSVSLIFFTFRSHLKVVLSTIVIASTVTAILFIATPQMFQQFINEVDQVIRKKERIEHNRVIETDPRVSLYIKTIEMIKENLFLGVGSGNWKKELPKYGLKNTIGQKGDKFAQRPHSDFLWFFSEGGLLSGISYILMFIFLLREALFFYFNIKDEKRYFFLVLFSTILGYVIISLFDFPSERPSHNLFLSIISGIIIGEKLKKSEFYNKTKKLVGVILMCLFSVNIAFASIRYKGDLHMTNALKYKSKNDWNRMINELNSAYNPYLFDMDNTTTPLHWYYGLAYFNKGEVDIAFDYFQEAYSVNPYHLHVLNNLATCYGLNNDYGKAKELYKKCIAISPRFEDAALNLASIYSYENRNEEALDILLCVRNFRIHNIVSDNYIEYFNNISSRLLQNSKYNIANINFENKIPIFGNNKDVFYSQLREIYLLRSEGNNFYLILEPYTL